MKKVLFALLGVIALASIAFAVQANSNASTKEGGDCKAGSCCDPC